jgi:hypothetical protein
MFVVLWKGLQHAQCFCRIGKLLERYSYHLPPPTVPLRGIQVGQLLGISLKKLNLMEIFQKYTFSSDMVNCYIGTTGIPGSLLVMDLAHRICEYALASLIVAVLGLPETTSFRTKMRPALLSAQYFCFNTFSQLP